MRKIFLITFILTFGLLKLSYCQDTTSLIQLFEFKFNPSRIDSCGDQTMSATLYTMLKGDVIDIDSLGFIICKLSHTPNDFNSNFRICKVRLAGVGFTNNITPTLEKLKKIIKNKKILVLSAQSKCTNDTNFEGLVEFENYSINYSLLRNGLGNYRHESYTLDFWTGCKFEEAVRIHNSQK